MPAASLRYFDSQGGFARALNDALGTPLPLPLRAARSGAAAAKPAPFVLIWRSPMETILLGGDEAALAELARQLAGAADGCMVEQTGGMALFRVQGRRTEDLLLRLGAGSALPELGEARTGRFAELTATAVRIDPDEVLLLVERVYAHHLHEWMSVTAGDF